MTAAEATIDPSRIHSLTRPNVVSVGTIVWLSSELMFFAGLFAMYFSIRAAAPELWTEATGHLNVPYAPADVDEFVDSLYLPGLFAMYFSIRAAAPELWTEATGHLNVPYALVFTIILVASSITCQLGVFAAEKGDVYALRRWFAITFVMGLVFVLGQVNEYRQLVTEGHTIAADGYWSMFYLTTGFHGLHVTGGLVAFIIFLIRTTMGRFSPAQATASIVVSYYWHFVDVVWIALFGMIYFLQ